MSSADPPASDSVATRDSRRALLNRVAESPVFQKSNRLRQLLLFLGERGLDDPDFHIREQDIGVEVFGRPAGYDTSQDTLVRVQASQLRKRLKEYFDGDGKHEPVTIDLPKGVYALVFKERDRAQKQPRRFRWRAWLPWAVAAVSVAAVIALITDDLRLRRSRGTSLEDSPLADAFWRQMFANRLNNYLVMSDGNLVVFEDQNGRDISIRDYQDKTFAALAGRHVEDPRIRGLTLNVLEHLYTGVADANMARKIGLLCTANHIQLSVVIARDIRETEVGSQNTVLLGSRRANPWIGLFEDKLNFRTVFQESPQVVWFTNREPRAGEPREYHGRFGFMGYCRVAFLKNPKGTGNTLLISGTDVQSTDAGGYFVTSEKWLQALRDALHLSSSDPFPHFEVLLGGQLVNSRVPEFQMISVRRH